MPISRDTRIVELELSEEVRELLRRWCPSVVTVADFDAVPIRRMFASLRPCRERTLGAGVYRTLGLPPLELGADEEDEAPSDYDDAGCLYVHGPARAVRAAVVEICVGKGLVPVSNVTSAEMAEEGVHRKPRTTWKSDVVVVRDEADGWVAVGSREWELSFPGQNGLALELSRQFPVLALTRSEAFSELSVYNGGVAVQTFVSRGTRTFRLPKFGASPSRELLVELFGDDPRWDDAESLGPEAFENQGFSSDIESIFDTYAHEDVVHIEELLGFRAPKPLSRKPLSRKRAESPPKAAVSAAGAAVMAIVSKSVFEKSFGGATIGDVTDLDRYLSKNAALDKAADGCALFLVTARPGDQLWLVAILEAPEKGEGMWKAAPNSVPITDLTSIMDRIAFANGNKLAFSPGKLGMSLQTPRALPSETAAAIRAAAGAGLSASDAATSGAVRSDSKTSDPERASVAALIGQVRWESLSQAFGEASVIGHLLRMLLVPGQQEEALEELRRTVVHEDTRYSASVPVVSILLAMLQLPDVPRVGIVELLGALSSPVVKVTVRADVPGEQHAFGCRQEVRSGIGQLRALLGDQDPVVRSVAAYALACVPEELAASRSALEARLDREPDADVRAALVVTLAHAGSIVTREEDDALVRFSIALGEILVRGAEADDEALANLLPWTNEDVTLDSRWKRLPWPSHPLTSLAGDAGLALAHVARRPDLIPLPQLLAVAEREASFRTAEPMKEALLSLTFGPLPREQLPTRRAEDLAPEQVSLLEAMVGVERLWSGISSLRPLQRRGLPETREGLATFLRTPDLQAELAQALRLTAEQPEQEIGYLTQAEILKQLGREHKSDVVAVLEAGVRRVASSGALRVRLGEALPGKDSDRKLALFAEASELDPHDVTAWHLRGRTLALLNRHAEAIEPLERATQIEPALANAWVWLGFAREKLGDDDGAEHALRKNAELLEDSSPAYLGLARIASRRGEEDVAISHIATARSKGFVPFDTVRREPAFAKLLDNPALLAVFDR